MCVHEKGEYHILNKQYSEEEYRTLRRRIMVDMDTRPYVSKAGHTYRYGEFFPPEFSPHAYNDSFASRFFPMPEQEVRRKGLRFTEPEKRSRNYHTEQRPPRSHQRRYGNDYQRDHRVPHLHSRFSHNCSRIIFFKNIIYRYRASVRFVAFGKRWISGF